MNQCNYFVVIFRDLKKKKNKGVDDENDINQIESSTSSQHQQQVSWALFIIPGFYCRMNAKYGANYWDECFWCFSELVQRSIILLLSQKDIPPPKDKSKQNQQSVNQQPQLKRGKKVFVKSSFFYSFVLLVSQI